MNIYQKINEVRKAVDYIQRDASVQGYKAVTHDMVTAKVRDQLIKHGIVILTDQRIGEAVDFSQTKNGTPIIRYEAWYEISFVNMDDPDDRAVIRVQSHANDQGDKAPGKAMSYAVKYAILKMFNLETGENEESRMEEERRGKLVLEHLKEELSEYIDHGDSLGVWLFSQNIGPETWTDLYNSAPDGKKMSFKKTCDEMQKQGHEILKEINRGILSDDSNLVVENISDITDQCKRMLVGKLGEEKTKILKRMKSEAA